MVWGLGQEENWKPANRMKENGVDFGNKFRKINISCLGSAQIKFTFKILVIIIGMYTKLPNGQIVYEEDYSCIVQPQNGRGGIFIGNLEASQNIKTLKKHGIKAVLTAAKGVDLTHSKTDIPFYLQIQGEDRDGFDLTRFFPQAISFITQALEKTNIMVHCLAGVSRSVCLVLAYFIKCKGMTYDEAYRLVKSKRSIIHPNDGFISQLKKYEREVRMCEHSKSGHHIAYSASPTKRTYDYYYSPEKSGAKFDRYERRDSTTNYESPSKNAALNYESPSKYANHHMAYQSPTKYDRYQASPTRRPTYEYKYSYDVDSPSPRRNQTASPRKAYQPMNPQPQMTMNAKRGATRRLMSMAQYPHGYVEAAYVPPERKQAPVDYVPRGRSTSDMNSGKGSAYDKKYQHTSTLELSEELDNKIAMIRKKYAEYTQSSISTSKGNRPRDYEPKLNNYLDQNDIRLSEGLGLRKMTSDYERYGQQKLGNDYGAIKNNLGRSSVSGLNLRKMNSMRDAY